MPSPGANAFFNSPYFFLSGSSKIFSASLCSTESSSSFRSSSLSETPLKPIALRYLCIHFHHSVNSAAFPLTGSLSCRPCKEQERPECERCRLPADYSPEMRSAYAAEQPLGCLRYVQSTCRLCR